MIHPIIVIETWKLFQILLETKIYNLCYKTIADNSSYSSKSSYYFWLQVKLLTPLQTTLSYCVGGSVGCPTIDDGGSTDDDYVDDVPCRTNLEEAGDFKGAANFKFKYDTINLCSIHCNQIAFTSLPKQS